MKRYEGLSDEELILMLRDGENGIIDYIMDKYKGLVRNKARSMYLLGGDVDDLIQEGMIGLFKAVRDYDAGRDASFFTFADLCVSRQMYTAVQASARKKHIPLNRSLPLSAGEVRERNQEDEAYGKVNYGPYPDGAWEKSPEELFIDRENLEMLEQKIERELSAFEKQVLDLYMTGMGYAQIARVLGRDQKSTDNALQRIKGKLRRALEEV